VSAICAAAAILSGGCGGDERPVSEGPNLVLITADDMALDSFTREAMPQTMELLVDDGTVPEDFVVTTPLCCPSRAALLTGQYGHNNGVLANRYGLLRDHESTIAVWLRDAGYHTAHVGKWLNGYDRVSKKIRPAPGWDTWATVTKSTYYDYDLYREEGEPDRFGSEPEDHLTRVITDEARAVISERATEERPLFLQVDYYAPHSDPSDDERCGDAALPEPEDSELFLKPAVPRPPSFNEANTRDKPPFQQRGRLAPESIERIQRRFGCTLASLRGVDRGIAGIAAELEAAGELDNTAIVFMGDNGMLRGQHRFSGGKHLAYAETLEVPVAIRVPPELLGGTEAPPRLRGPSANIDVAPTFLDLAGAEPCAADGNCRVMDGRSLVGALDRSEPLDPDRALVIELDEEQKPEKLTGPCRYRGLRTASWFYLEHEIAQDPRTGRCRTTDFRELYDRERDPFELRNLLAIGTESFVGLPVQRLSRRLERLHDCQGIAGRDPEPPKGIAYCE